MEPLNRLDNVLDRFAVRAHQIRLGPLCDRRRFDAGPGQGFLHILREGRLTVVDGEHGAPRVVSEPSVLFYPRALPHTFEVERPDARVDLACALLEFEGGEHHPLVRALPEVITVPIADVAGLDLSLALLHSEIDEFRCGRRHVIDRLFEIALLKLLRWLLDHPHEVGLPPGLITGFSDLNIARALAGMHADPGRAWSLEELGGLASMSRSAFSARFRELVGETPHGYLTTWRLAVGRQLLREGRTISDVAAELGYTSSSFSRLFSSREGRSPRAWVQAHRGGGGAAARPGGASAAHPPR